MRYLPRGTAHAPRVLIVDDDEATRRACSKALRLQGYDVLEAGNMEEGIAHLRVDAINISNCSRCGDGKLDYDEQYDGD